MPNMRVIHDNCINRAASVVASTTAGNLAASNLLTEFKTEVWRSTATTAALTLTWNAPETISGLVAAFSNLTSTATVKVQCYTQIADSTPAYDSGDVQAMLGTFSGGKGVNSFAYGGTSYGAVWFSPTACRKVVVTINDSSNTSGYIELSKLVLGNYWSPERNVDSESLRVIFQDSSKQERSDDGGLWIDRGTISKKIAFDLGVMSNNDRSKFWEICMMNGNYKPVFVSVIPESQDSKEEQIYSIYGYVSGATAIQYKFSGMSATQLQLEEI